MVAQQEGGCLLLSAAACAIGFLLTKRNLNNCLCRGRVTSKRKEVAWKISTGEKAGVHIVESSQVYFTEKYQRAEKLLLLKIVFVKQFCLG
jgi:hypothetical protein